MTRLQFTVYTSTAPHRLTKIFGLSAGGTLTKTTAANMMAGAAERVAVADLHELAAQLDKLTSAQAVGWGIGAWASAGQASINLCRSASRPSGVSGVPS